MKDFQKLLNGLFKKIQRLDLLIIPTVLILILFIVVLIGIFEKGQNIFLSTNPSPLSYTARKYPFLENKFNPTISAGSAIILDKESKTILYSKNPNFRFSPASTTKIMTALVALDYFDPQDILEVKEETGEDSILHLMPGDRFTFESLLYAMMLPSANDAAFAISQNYPGGTTAFVNKMNEKANDLNLPSTHFDDPAGLIDRNDYTTAWELARLTDQALDNKFFAKIVATPSRLINDTSGNSYFIFNRNKLLGYDGVNGVKTGTTEEAGDVLVTSKNTNGHTIIIVVLKSLDRFADTYELLNLISSDNLTFLSIHP